MQLIWILWSSTSSAIVSTRRTTAAFDAANTEKFGRGPVAPGPLSRLFTLVADKDHVREGRALYHRYLPLIEFVGGQRYVAGSEALLRHMGLPAGQPRPPRLPLPPALDAAAAELVRTLGLRPAL